MDKLIGYTIPAARAVLDGVAGLCLFIALIHYMIADENYKIILMAIIPALYCFVMTRYLTTVLETIEKQTRSIQKDVILAVKEKT